MLKFQKHIATFLLLVFAIPVIYQQVHIIQHHVSFIYHSCCDNHEHAHNNSESKNSNITSFSENENKKACVICEYQFTINQMPLNYRFTEATNYYIKYRHPFIEQHLVCSVISGTPSRAPPGSIFVS